MKQTTQRPSQNEVKKSTKEFLNLLDRSPILLIFLDDMRKKAQRRGLINGIILVFLIEITLEIIGLAVCLALGITPLK